jgi:hypothetical protein
LQEKHTQPHNILHAAKHTHTKLDTKIAAKDTKSHNTNIAEKKHKADTEGRSSGHKVKPKHKASGGSFFNVC